MTADGWSAPLGLTPDGRRLAGPGKRFLGLFLDGLLWGLPALVLYGLFLAVIIASAPAQGEAAGAGFVLGILAVYGFVFLLGIAAVAVESELLFRRGRTWGMGWTGLRVVDARTGAPISRGRAWGRTLFARFISGQICGLGYWWALFDNRNRTLHDLVVGTVVIEEAA